VEECKPLVPGIELSFVVSRSFGDEFGEAIGGDIIALQMGFVLIIIYASLMLSRWDQAGGHSRC
jgi:hypothetical protein